MIHGWILETYRAEKESGTPQSLIPPATERLDALRVPVLSILGDLDDPGTQAACRHLASSVPGARLEVFEGAAHMLNSSGPTGSTACCASSSTPTGRPRAPCRD